MIIRPLDVLAMFPVRKSKQQKKRFRNAVTTYAAAQGYNSTIEKGSLGVNNVVIGDSQRAQYLITAHYDTPARLPFPNLITPCNFWAFLGYQLLLTAAMLLPPVLIGIVIGALTGNIWVGELSYFLLLLAELFLMLLGPANPNTANDNTSGVVTVLELMRCMPAEHRDKVCFILFDLEEAGLLGSAAYRRAHKKESENQIVLNLDCVGDGDEILFFPTRKLKKQATKMDALRCCTGSYGRKSIAVRENGFAMYPSDQKNFPFGVGIAAFRRSNVAGLYCSRIHTPKDTVLEEKNVNVLCDALLRYITGETQPKILEEMK